LNGSKINGLALTLKKRAIEKHTDELRAEYCFCLKLLKKLAKLREWSSIKMPTIVTKVICTLASC
jgi:hypothetical protein